MRISKITLPFCVAQKTVDYKPKYNMNISFTSQKDSFERTTKVSELSKKDTQLVENILSRENTGVKQAKQLTQEADKKSREVLEKASYLLKAASSELAKKNSRNEVLGHQTTLEFKMPGEMNKYTATYTSYNGKQEHLLISVPSEIAGKTNNYHYLRNSSENLKFVFYEEGYHETEPGFSEADIEIQFDDHSDWVKYAKIPVYHKDSRKSDEFLYKSHNAITYYKDLEYFKPFIYESSKKAKTEVILNKDLSLCSYGEDYDFNEYREINHYSVFHSLEPVGRIYENGVTSKYDYSKARELHAKNEFLFSDENKWVKL